MTRHLHWMAGPLIFGAIAINGCRDARPTQLVTASVAAPVPVPSASALPSSALADAGCSGAGAPGLAADAGSESEVVCFRAYYGIGGPADLVRARACFERVVCREKDFAGSSPSLPRIFLGLMLLDGQGGERDRERGKALFVDCYLGNDSGVSAAALAREQSGAAKPIDFCEDIGGTTLDTNACAEIRRDKEQVEALEAVKEIRAKLALDSAGLALWSKAEGAWDHFSSEDVRYAGDAYRGGSMRIAQETWIAAARARGRVELLRALLDSTSAREDAEGELKQAEASARAEARDAENRKLLADAQAAWKVYRAAEIAFGRRALAQVYGGEAAAARAVGAELAKRRAQDLRDAVKALKGE